MKTKMILAATTILFLTSLALYLSPKNATGAGLPSERFLGYNTEIGKWTTGNLGKAYVEGDWVSYQLWIDKGSKVWGAPEFSISFNFHQDSSAAIYVDGFDTSVPTGFQYAADGTFLTDGTETPPGGWGTHIPTPAAGEGWVSGPKITNYMDAWPPGTGDGTPAGSDPADERYFSVNGLPWGSFTDHVILFYRSHLALDIIWWNGLESALPTQLDGDEFQTWTAVWHGASFATGSSRHFFLQYPGIGGKTIPIPIAAYPSTIINGHKYVNNVLFNGWKITLNGEITLGSGLPPIPYNPPSVLTGTAPWTTGYYEFTGLVMGVYKVTEEDRAGYVHENIIATGTGTDLMIDIPGGWAKFGLTKGGTETVDFYNLPYIDIQVSKDATPSWKQTLTWTVDKTATPTLSKIFVNDEQDVKYTVTVTATVAANEYKVSGTITIDNPNMAIVVVKATILDEVWDGMVLKGSQDLTPGGAIVIPPGVSTYSYSITLSLPVDVSHTFTNKVTVTVTEPVSRTYTFTKDFFYTKPTELVDDNVDVTDSLQGFLGTVNYMDSPKTFTYTRTYGPYAMVDTYTIDNTATAKGDDTGTDWTASASVKIEVYDITVSKTAITYWERTFGWTITKSVVAAQLNPFINDQIQVKYTISVTKWVDTDFFKVSGTITIVNNNPAKSAVVYVVDMIYDGTTVVGSQDLGSHTIAPGATLTLNYEITFAATPGKEYTNKAHVQLNNYHWDYLGAAIDGPIGTTEFVGMKAFTYTEPDMKVNDSVLVTDVQVVPAGLSLISSNYPSGGWTTSVDATFTINKVVKAVQLGMWDLKDEAFAKGDTMTWKSGEKTLTFNVYDVTVSKTAEPWWKRTFDWTIEKSATPTELILYKGGTGTVTYTVTITKIVAEDQYKVFGTITIVNNNPEKYAVVHVIDKIHAPDGSVVGFQDLGTHTIAPLGTLKLDYEIFFTPTTGVEYKNVAHVDLENNLWKLDGTHSWLYNTEFTGSATFTFTEPTVLVDDSATVTEEETVPPEFSATVDWGTAGPPPWTVTDSTTIVFKKTITDVSATPCVWYELPDTVKLTESDTGAMRQASALVKLHVPIAHTVGYWKNHPEAWKVISPNDPFPWTTGKVAGYTYMQILQTTPDGDASIILAQQYIAAKLNYYAYGVPPSIATAISNAEAFFAGTSSSPFYPTAYPAGSDPQGAARDYAIALATKLENYNKSTGG